MVAKEVEEVSIRSELLRRHAKLLRPLVTGTTVPVHHTFVIITLALSQCMDHDKGRHHLLPVTMVTILQAPTSMSLFRRRFHSRHLTTLLSRPLTIMVTLTTIEIHMNTNDRRHLIILHLDTVGLHQLDILDLSEMVTILILS